MKYCKKCGKEFEDSMMYCANCGGNLEQKTTGPEATGQNASGGMPNPKPKFSKIILVLVAALIVGYVAYDRFEEHKKQIEANKLMAFAKYDEIGEFGGYGAEGLALVRQDVEGETFYGFINKRYEECIPCFYQRIEPFEGDVTIVELEDKYALMNKHGEIVEHLKYSEIGDFSDEGYARATAKDKWWLINREGEEILPAFNGIYEGHEYVDLGLPSGTLWATCNVGAITPEGYGDYFAWGETQPKTTYDWSTYKYAKGSDDKLTKYCTVSVLGYNGFTDNLTVLQPGDDAATANWGNGWSMPTREQWEELYQYTTYTVTTRNGVNGGLFTADNGESIFLPADGRHIKEKGPIKKKGSYWSSSLSAQGSCYAWRFSFLISPFKESTVRDIGLSVRAVREN